MKNKAIKFSPRIITTFLICCISVSAFMWSKLTTNTAAETKSAEAQANEQENVLNIADFTANPSQSAPSVKAAERGFPLLNLQDGKKLGAHFVGADGATQSLDNTDAQPVGLMTGDFNNDGAADLISAYSGSNGGYLAFYQGNPETLSARSPETFEAMKEGRFPVPFSSKAVLINLPVSPDFYGTGDFNRDGLLDILVAARGDSAVYLFAGNGRGGFKQQKLEMPGQVTAMTTGKINPLENSTDAAVSVNGQDGAQLLIYSGTENAFSESPAIYSLPGTATSLALGQLDNEAPIDILAAVGTQAVIIHGSYPVKDENGAIQQIDNSNQVEIINQAFDIAAARVGNFTWDRDYKAEIALLDTNGAVHILERSGLNKTAYTAEEQKKLWLVRREKALAQEAAHGENIKTRQRQTNRSQIWSETDNIQVSAPFDKAVAGNPTFFTSTRMTTEAVDDLIVLDSANQKLQVLVKANDELKQTGETFNYSMTGERAAVSFDVAGTPVAALPMRLSVMTRPGIVVLNKESADISYLIAAPAATFTVTKTADTFDGTCNTDCSLREAIHAANLTSAADIVMVPAGTYTTTIGPADADFTNDPAAEQSGDFDVFYDLTITGAGQATTIIQAGNSTATGLDRVLDAIQLSAGVPDLSLSGVTLRNGRCAAATCGDGGGLRYNVDALANLTISDTTITANRTEVNTASPANNGGGIDATFGTNNFTNLTVSNNVAGFRVDSCTNCSGEGGGIGLFGSNSTNPTSLTMTNGTVTGNQALTTYTAGGRGGALAVSLNSQSISGGTFTGNSADGDGGGFRLFTTTNFTNSPTISTNSSKQNGGGIWSDPVDINNNPTTVSVTGASMQGNAADSDNTIAISGTTRNGDGGAIFHDRGTLNLTTVNIGNVTANTAYNGGGIGHFYLGPNFAGNASTININGGSIVNNIANNNGGGIANDATRTAGATSTVGVAATTAVTFTGNKAKNNGGGIANYGGLSGGSGAVSNLNNMTLRSNQANSDSSGGGDGGAVYNDGAFTTPSTVTFTGTLTVGGSGFANSAANGGGLRNNSGTMTIPANASVTFNTASATGGGISNAGTLSALSSATITNNTATGNGGAIFNAGTLGSITTPTFTGNSAANGGGIYSSNGILTVTNGSISSNTTTASAAGGGILYAGSGASTVTGTTVNSNTGSGVYITANALDITNSTITNNSADGISVTGTGTGSELISGNTIFNNGGLGIDLSDNGVTPNDTNDTDTGPNNLQNFPIINYVKSTGEANVTLNSTASRSFRINFFANTACDPSGNGEGEVSLGTQNVTTSASNTVTFNSVALAFGTRKIITATATDLTTGDTSEFSPCRTVNTPPTITAQTGVTRQQGSPATSSQIATVSDVDQAANTLTVTVNGSTSATVNGVTVSGIAIDASGNVTASIVATCGATNAAFTLRATDNATEFNEATLNVAVTANTAPTVGNYANTTVNAGSNITVTPDAAPTDNGSIASVTASAPAAFTGTFSGNTTTGAVTITNAAPVGTYTITVTTTDNCGLSTPKTFTLTVNAIPTITAQSGVSRQQGNAATNSQIATVNDADQSANTLVVTVRAVGGAAPGTGTATVNGVTVSNIAVSAAGVVTADVVAACGATNAAFTLRVTDSNGAFSEATLNVAVTANTAPTVGTYSNTLVNTGGTTTVTPNAAPSDNGTFTGTVSSSAGFTGTLAVNQTTGVVTVTNAAPAGTYTITVTFTDNCGSATQKTFTLTVNTPPTISAASGVSRQQGNGTSNSQIATVNDADQTENTLVVTVNGGASATVNGITISNIAVSAAGVVTADIVANGTATAASFTLRVTDNQGAFAEDTLNVAVTPASYEADVSPRPSGDASIDASDIQEIRRFAIGLDLPYQSNEFQRADCAPRSSSGDGFVDSDDVQQARRYSVGTDPKQFAAGPSTPPSSFQQLETARLLVDSLMNKVSNKQLNIAAATPALRIDNQSTSAGQTVTVPIRVDTAGNEAGYTFSLSYDQTKLTNPQITIGTAGGDIISNALTAGQIGISVTSFSSGTIAAGTNLLLLNVSFTVAANAPSGQTNISFTDLPARRKASGADPNVAILQPTFADGTVTITAPTAAQVSISGRVISIDGRGVAGATLTMTDQLGQTRTARTNQSGFYRFENVEVGTTYIVNVTSKKYVFAPQILNLTEELNSFDFTATQ